MQGTIGGKRGEGVGGKERDQVLGVRQEGRSVGKRRRWGGWGEVGRGG